MTSRNIRTALVTGGAARIGAAIVRDLARHDFAVAIHTNNSATQAQELAAEIVSAGGRVTVVQGDLSDPVACKKVVEEAAAGLGPLGLLVNNASIFRDDSIEALDTGILDQHFAIHVRAPSILTGDFARQLPANRRGLVVNIIDQRIWALNPRFYSYTLSKSALWTATQTLAQALAPRIRVNAIGPGPTLQSASQTEEDFQAQVNGLILKAGPRLEEFGQTIRFLYDTPSITGQMIALDGGQHLAWQTPDIAEINE
ncbi:SDR family oxidoreductase [Rhizobium sp. KVB221]|uniref:SDR family oxidoreductase n=1 Tax=Rhizobium setariae TaxID=2801340 RepID=A0A937CP07_9HYPH|nr:SDR family oxidoreductase [Rhizobium setariae]MBL0371272.1 SDR family oxidoreductase [Rhizobium setariae]